MSSFWNPFKTDKHYFVRTFDELWLQYLLMLVGDHGDEETLGLLDYVVFPILIARWVAKRRHSAPNSLLHKIIIVFLILKAFFVGLLLIPLLSLPFLAIYHHILLWIGRPLKKCLDNLEILPWEGRPDRLYVTRLGTLPKIITFDTVQTLLPAEEDHCIVLFEDNTMLYLSRVSKQLQIIEPSAENDFDQQFKELSDRITKQGPYSENAPSAAYIKLQKLFDLRIHRNFNIFFNHYYERDITLHSYFHGLKITLLRKHPIRYLDLRPMYTEGPETRHLILHVCDLRYPGRRSGFIIPSKENKALLKPLLDRNLFQFFCATDETFTDLAKALEEPDPFRQEVERRRQLPKLRTDTPKFLLEVLGSPAKVLYPIITDYLGYEYTTEEKEVVAKSLGVESEDAKPAASYKAGP